MITGISTALGGIQRATQQLNSSSKQLAEGNLDETVIVESQISKRNVQANIASLKALSEVEESALDILA